MTNRHKPHHRPLIDQIPDHNPYDVDLDVSDEEDAFYAVDEGDYLLHPKWRALIVRTSNRIPRRLQRYIVICFFAAVVFLTVWFGLIWPRYSTYMQDTWDMDAAPKNRFGLNKRPEFKDLLQVGKLDERFLPKGDGRLVVVGDVHGCRKELDQLLRKSLFREGRDHLVLTGDIIAKGPDSSGVVDMARRLNASCVRGNHEDRVLLSLAEITSVNPLGPDAPIEQSLTERDYATRNLAKSFSEDQISYLKSCPVILDVGTIGTLHNIAIVHAGLVPDVAFEDQDPYQVMNMRSIVLKTRVPSETREGKPWEMFWNHQQKKKPEDQQMNVIYGHDSKRGANFQKFSFGLDSGCVSGGRLTAMLIRESGDYSFVMVDCKEHGK